MRLNHRRRFAQVENRIDELERMKQKEITILEQEWMASLSDDEVDQGARIAESGEWYNPDKLTPGDRTFVERMNAAWNDYYHAHAGRER